MTKELTIKEKACNAETWEHIHLVAKNICIINQKLTERMLAHDQTKLSSPEVELFAEFTPKTENNLELFEGEVWKPVINFEGQYDVSSYGRVRSKDRIVKNSRSATGHFKKGIILKQNITPRNYCRVQFQTEGCSKNFLVHRLVAEAFLDNKGLKSEVNHKNGETNNNYFYNLEWVTPSENQTHAYDTDLKKAHSKYEVTCDDLSITTNGIIEMKNFLKKKGYEKAHESGIWRSIKYNKRYLGLKFTGKLLKLKDGSYISNMTLIDIVEMFCDWHASSKRQMNGNIRKSIEKNRERDLVCQISWLEFLRIQ